MHLFSLKMHKKHKNLTNFSKNSKNFIKISIKV